MFSGLRNFHLWECEKITTTFTFFGWTYPLMSDTLTMAILTRWCLAGMMFIMLTVVSVVVAWTWSQTKVLDGLNFWPGDDRGSGSGCMKFTAIDPKWSVNVCMKFHGDPNVAIFHHKCRPPGGRRENQRTSMASSSGNNGCLDQIVPISLWMLRYFSWFLLV